MATLILNVTLQVEVEVLDSALTDDTLITEGTLQVLNNLYDAFKNNNTRFTTVEPATLVVGTDVYDL